MKRLLGLCLAATAVWLAGRALPAQSSPAVDGLRCEYLVNPLGIDVETPRLSWMLAPGPRGREQAAYRILVASSPEKLRKDTGDLWDSGRVASARTAWVPYGGKPLASGERAWWKVRTWNGRVASPWSASAFWSMGLLRDSDWQAKWVGMARPADARPGTPQPFPWLRRDITLAARPARATAYVNALGYYELYVNGQKVDDHVLAPAVVDYSKRSFYVTHDITALLKPGKNALALWLGRGWYVRGHPGVIHDGPLVRAHFDIEGSAAVATDESWSVRPSPILPLGKGTAFGDYGGERYDARLELEGWSTAAPSGAGWQPAAVFDPPAVPASAQMVEPNRLIQEMRPAKIEKTPAGGWLIDMGRNYTGWLALRLPAGVAEGTAIKIEYADNPPAGGRYGTFNQRDEYVARAGAGQTIQSRFNYHAFRYAHVTGLAAEPSPADIKGWLIRTAYGRTSEFESSDELLNRIYRTAAWTYECLTLGGYVVDCPTRERLGYGGDAGTSIETGLFNFDTGGLYNRWSINWRDAQDPKTGDVPYTAPNYPDQGGGGPMWSGFVVALPWNVYLQYGDKRILETNYPAMRKWLEFAQSKTVNGILEPYNSVGMSMPQWNYLGDWVAPRLPGGGGDIARHPVASRFINNCYYLYNLQLAGKIAALVGKPDDAARWDESAAALKKVLHERYYDAASASYATGQQPYLALPLLLGVTPPELRDRVMRNLERTILETNTGHIDAGMHGTYFLLKFLMQEDRNDLIYRMASQKDYPGWGNMLEQGGTTMWESWTGGSHIHDTLISIGSWFIQGIGGIRADEAAPGFTHFTVKPALVGDLSFARAKYRSARGEISSEWRRENGGVRLDVTVPPGTTATVYVPSAAPAEVTESGKLAAKAPGVSAVAAEKRLAVFRVASGRYSFFSRL